MTDANLVELKQFIEQFITTHVADQLNKQTSMLRKEMAAGFDAMRQEMASGFQAVRSDMAAGFAGVADSFEHLNDMIEDQHTQTTRRLTLLEKQKSQ